jgi:lipoyl(octanoyl) transferase
MNYEFIDWGLIDYQTAWDKQKELVVEVQKGAKSKLIFCEHPTVITVGKNGSADNLTKSEEFYKENNIEVIWINRGGDVTMHNPKQLVAYPIFNLTDFKQDLHWFLRKLEDCIIDTIAEYGLEGDRYDGFTGVWLEQARKICAMGLHCSRWVTSHGLALNVSNDISEFEYIIPCGIKEKKVTSIQSELGTYIDIEEVKTLLIKSFYKNFIEL